MKRLYWKELKLNVRLPLYLLCALGAMVLIPNYPIIVGVGYSVFQVFLYMQFMRENRSQEFSATLPVKRNDIVTSTTLVIVTLQMMTTLVVAVGAAIVRTAVALGSLVYQEGNVVGLDANLTFLGVALLCLAVFNLIFIPKFFKTGYKYGVPILLGLVGFCAVYMPLEIIIQLVPTLRGALDGYDVAMIWARIVVLIVGAMVYGALTFAANRLAQKNFEKVSL